MGLFGKKKKDPRERRRVYRIPEKNAMLIVNDISYPVMDWSIDGFGAQGFRGGLNTEDTARTRLIILHRGKPVGFDAKARIIRADPENQILAGQFTSMIFSVQYRLPDYYRWLLYDADHGPAYRYHRMFLQHLQSAVGGQWLLKSPAHLWHLDALIAEYPDALIVQTHRDPLNVISSISALTHHLRRLASDESSITDCAAQSCEEIVVGLERATEMRDSGVLPESQVIDVHFADFMRDPLATVRTLYTALGRELDCTTETRMREHLAAHPGDHGGTRYRWSDTGLDAGEVRERVRRYQERYGVGDEPLR